MVEVNCMGSSEFVLCVIFMCNAGQGEARRGSVLSVRGTVRERVRVE